MRKRISRHIDARRAWKVLPAAALLCALAAPLVAQQSDEDQYQGPTILSRNKPDVAQRGGKLVDFRYYGQVTGIYDDGMLGVSVDSAGKLVNVGTQYGVDAGFGVIGAKQWQHDLVKLEYRGDYAHYQPNTFFNGLNQYLALDYVHVFSRSWTLDLHDTGGISNNSFGDLAYLPQLNNSLSAVPTNELFDNRIYFNQTGMALTWNKTRRLSFSFSGDGFWVRRRSAALAGLNGGRGVADVAYRIAKKQTISASYDYTVFDYQRAFGNANIQSVSIGYSITLGRFWDLSLSVGGIRAHTLGLTQVAVDPAVAAIVGRNFAIVTFAPTIYVPKYDGRLQRNFKRSALTFTYSRGIAPGNGVYLTSREQDGNVAYSYTGLRRLTLAGFGGYSQLDAIGQKLGQFQSWMGGAGATYKLMRNLFLEARYDYRRYTTQDSLYKQNENRVSVGLAFSPSSIPLAIW